METSVKKPITLSFTTLPSSTQKALTYLSKLSWLKEDAWYLAGGTALALQCKHRQSVDLDFFTQRKNFDQEKIISQLIDQNWNTTLVQRGTLYGELLGAKISFISYPFFLPKQAYHTFGFIQVLDAKDIAVMKILAVSQRGRKRDFFDLYWYIQNREQLINVIKKIDIQYPKAQHNYHHILKSLTYFEEAEADPDPQIYFDTTWMKVKNFFMDEVSKVGKDILDLS